MQNIRVSEGNHGQIVQDNGCVHGRIFYRWMDEKLHENSSYSEISIIISY